MQYATHYEEGKKAALRYQEIFGKGNFFLELQDHGIPEQRLVNQQLMRMSQETGIELAATNDVHYTYESDADSHDILLCIQTGKKVSDEDRMRYEGGQYYVKSEEEMRSLFPYALQALENTQKIADRCEVNIEFGVTKLPRFDVPEGYTAWEYLNKLCREGLERLYDPVTEELKERLDYELNTIRTMGYVDYFLIVWDFIKFARDHEIMVGPGRGSAAGSLVSYTLGITQLDPMRYQLLFERFLNPERVTMPDIDVDFCFERRQEVIDYVTRKYGKDRVVQIVTFGTLAARGVIRDVGRVLDLPYAQVDSIAKMIPTELNITIDKALGAGSTDNYESVTYEGYGPGGVAVIVEALTDNRQRTAPEVRHAFDKCNGNLGAQGCVSWSFDKKGVIVIDNEEGELDEDTVMMDALEAGAADFEADGPALEITCDPDAFNDVVKALEGKGYAFASAEIEMVPQNYITLTGEGDVKNMEKLIDMLEDNDDVQNVWHNWNND